MTEHTWGPHKAAGMTLLEVLVAFTLLSVSLAIIMSIFSGGLRTSARGYDYSRAVALAESKLAAVNIVDQLVDGTTEGAFDAAYRWRTTVRAPEWWEPPAIPTALEPREIQVDVAWTEFEREHSVSLTTLRLVRRPI